MKTKKGKKFLRGYSIRKKLIIFPFTEHEQKVWLQQIATEKSELVSEGDIRMGTCRVG